MVSVQPYFVALLPKSWLETSILDRKRQVYDRVGPQLYLDDPPHLTVFLSCFQDRSELVDRFQGLSAYMTSIAVELVGWHVFERDCLTGNNTLVLTMSEESKRLMRSMQQIVLDHLSSLRDPLSSEDRYRSSWDSLTDARQLSVQRYGFPFTGEDWQPHFTIASVKQADWVTCWATLEDQSIIGTFDQFSMGLFALEGKVPVLIDEFSLNE